MSILSKIHLPSLKKAEADVVPSAAPAVIPAPAVIQEPAKNTAYTLMEFRNDVRLLKKGLLTPEDIYKKMVK